MYRKSKSPTIFIPTTLNELMLLYKKFPEAQIYSGGTYILGTQTDRFINLNRNVIYTGKIAEMQKLTRSERYLEIGAGCTINTILSHSSNLIPPVLNKALSHIATPAVRNLATLGGNLGVPEKRMSSFPALYLLDAKLELKKQGETRWVNIKRFINEDGKPDLKAGEILSRIRIPFENWSYQKYEVIGDKKLRSTDYLIFTALARIEKDTVTEMRIVFTTGRNDLIRSRSMEDSLMGRHFPLSEREAEDLTEIFIRETKKEYTNLSEYERHRISKLLYNLFTEL